MSILSISDGVQGIPPTVEQVHNESTGEQWLSHRKLGLGGSDIAAVTGLNQWRTGIDVYADKVMNKSPNFDSKAEERMRWGTLLEDAVAQETAHRLNLQIVPGGGLWRDKERPWMLATPDRFIVKDGKITGILEVKTTGLYGDQYWTTCPPAYYRAQLIWYLGIFGFTEGWICCLIGGQKLATFPISPAPGEFEAMRDKAERFWLDHIEAKVPPPPNPTPGPRLLPPGVKKETADELDPLEVNDDLYGQINRCYDLATQRLAIQREEDELKDRINHQLGEHKLAIHGGEVVLKQSEVTSSRVNQDILKNWYPEVAKECCYESTSKRLLIFPDRKRTYRRQSA